jgi:hypothetical protein
MCDVSKGAGRGGGGGGGGGGIARETSMHMTFLMDKIDM